MIFDGGGGGGGGGGGRREDGAEYSCEVKEAEDPRGANRWFSRIQNTFIQDVPFQDNEIYLGAHFNLQGRR